MDELKLLREMRSDIPIVKDSLIERGHEQLLQRITPGQKNPGQKKLNKRRRTKGLRIAMGSLATLALVTALVAGNVVGPAGWRGAASAEAAEVLNQAAELTINTADPVVGPGQYLKIESTNLWPSGAAAASPAGYDGPPTKQWFWLDTQAITTYIPADRQDEWVMVRSGRIPTTFFDVETKDFVQKTQGLQGGTPQTWRGKGGAFQDEPSGMPSESFLASLPRNPYLLLNSIYKQSLGKGDSLDSQAMIEIAALLRTGLVPADLRAALYKAAAMIPGVTLVDKQATLDGQVGIAIGRVERNAVRTDIIIDPATGQLIGERTVTLQADGPLPAGTAGEWTTIRTTVVDSAP